MSSLTCSPSATGLASEVDGSASGAAAGAAAASVGAVCGVLCVLESGVSAGIVEARRGEARGAVEAPGAQSAHSRGGGAGRTGYA